MNKDKLISATFTLGESNYQGLYDPSINWNGFAVPYFDTLTCSQILIECGLENIPVTGNDPDLIIDGIIYTAIGGYEWCWMVVPPEFDFEVLRIAHIPDTYLLPDVLAALSTRRGYSDVDTDVDEFICAADVFTRMIEDEDEYVNLREELTDKGYDQWHNLSHHFDQKEIHYIHIIKN